MMKKFFQMFMLGLFLAGCSNLPSLPPLLASATPVPATETPTRSASATPIPTQNLFATSTPTPLTFTPTVTALGAELFTPTATETPFPTFAPPLVLSPDATSGGYFTPSSTGFLSIQVSSNTIHWDAGPCMPRNIRMSVTVEDPVNTEQVLLFLRLREKKNTLLVTEWGSGAIMLKEDNGSFTYNIRTFNIRRYYYFLNAWLEYQLVALNEKNEVIARTRIYDRDLSLVRCQQVP